MGRSPEAVTSNGFVPGNVPVEPGGNRDRCDHVRPDQPGNPLLPGRAGCFGHSAPSLVCFELKNCTTEYTEWLFSRKELHRENRAVSPSIAVTSSVSIYSVISWSFPSPSRITK